MEKKQRELNNKGFSLIELIVVIAIMAILVGAIAPQVTKYIKRARVAQDQQTLSTVYTAVTTGLADIAIEGKTTTGWDNTKTLDAQTGDLANAVKAILSDTLDVTVKSDEGTAGNADGKITVAIDSSNNVVVTAGTMKVTSKGYESTAGTK